MKLTFPVRPSGLIGELWDACLSLVQQLEANPRVIASVAISTTETAIDHGLGRVPGIAIPVPQANVTVWRSSAPDARFVYLTASSTCICDVLVYA